MSVEVAKYQFHSWARKGIANNIIESDDLGTGISGTKERAEIAIGVSLNDAGQSKKFSLVGPGDIIGVNPNMIVRTEPLNRITDTEPNYLAFIEFYDEEFAWRYTPAAPVGTKLRPWLFLLVLEDEEFEPTKRSLPLASVNITNKDVFPPAAETWLWAHVHSDADIPDSDLSDYEKFLISLNTTIDTDPDRLYCRLMSPRKLEANKAYHAMLIPAFEVGRLAGLEQPTDNINTQQTSWDANGAKGEMPVYFQWSFRTGVNADFESLVKLLEPRAMDPRVGIRDMDCSRPGFFIAADPDTEMPGTKPPIIGLEGALKSPTTVSTTFPDPPDENDFQVELQKMVNLPVTIIGQDDSGDPVISVPFYGAKHAKRSANDNVLLDITQKTWLHDLNKDPRTRVGGGLGTLVVQKNQETYMRKAWQQVMGIIEANKKIKSAAFYMKVALQLTIKTFNQLQPGALLAVSKPVLPRVMGSPTTIYQQVQESQLPAVVFSGAFRRIVRPKSKFMKRLDRQNQFAYHDLVTGLNDGTLTAAPPKLVPAGMPNTKYFADQVFSYKIPSWLKWLLKHFRVVFIILLALFILLALISTAIIPFAIPALALAAAYPAVKKLKDKSDVSDNLLSPQSELKTIESVPARPDFTLRLNEEPSPPPPTKTADNSDSVEARNFRTALTDLTRHLSVSAPQKKPEPLNLTNAVNKISKAIHPHTSFPLRLSYAVRFPGYIKFADPVLGLTFPEKVFPAMAWPDFEDPMYKKLTEISDELLLPNLKLIPPNTISLLKTNQKFIESYLVGLNHEMGRELLWREYPTDERGSYFRQFWDVNGIIQPDENKTEAQLTEEHKDIKPIHTWKPGSDLGRHNNRDAQGDAEQLVLVIRGDLLKRYPNTAIFAQKAIAGANPDEPVIDQDLSNTEFKSQVRFPLYKAEIPPEIKFFGFDLTIEQARGTELTPPFTDHLGWFFIIQQVPGEPRFGMDIEFNIGDDGFSWDDLAWTNFSSDTKFITASVKPDRIFPENQRWGTDSANMAYILFQKPSMVAVHAKEMLENLSTT